MAKISTYTIDSTIEGNDKLLGTDSASTSALATRNYTIDSLKAYIQTGSPANITDTIPLGFALTVNREGTAYERALVRTLAGSTLTNVVLKSATVNTGSDIYLNTLGSGQVFLIIRDYNNGQFAVDYDLADFAANAATWSGTIGGIAHTGTITTFNAPNFSNASPAANDTQYIDTGSAIYTDWAFNVTLDAGQTYTGGQVAFTEFTFLTGATQIETQTIGTLRVTRDIEVPDGDVTIGTSSPTTDPHNLTVYGDIKLPTSESRIKFGGDTNNVLMSTDGTDLTISGSGTGSNIVTNATRFTQDIVKDDNTTSADGRTIMGQNTFTAINTDGTRGVLSNQGVELQDSSGVALAQQQVSGNAPVGGLVNQGYLTSIKVDGNWFQLPALSSGVAEAFYRTSDSGVYRTNSKSGSAFGESSLNEAMKLIHNQKDENGNYVSLSLSQLIGLFPFDLWTQAEQMVNSTLVPEGNENAVNTYKKKFLPLTSPYVTAQSSSTWYIGDFKEDFVWSEVWPLQTFTDTTGVMNFTNDIKARYKVRLYGQAGALSSNHSYKLTS